MQEPKTTRTEGGSLYLFDERGTLIGAIDRPRQCEPLGPGREKVYLARRGEESVHAAA